MQLIKPSEISGQIMTLMEEADQIAILISPYVRISKWQKFTNRLNELKSRNIVVEIYVRENEEDSINEVVSLGFMPITVPNLHTKLYLNEKVAIVSSMNLLLSSDTNSIDIAMKTENEQEYKELYDYYTRYISNKASNNNAIYNGIGYQDWREELENQLTASFGNRIRIYETANRLQINTRNRYEVTISKKPERELHISGILSNKEFEYARMDMSAIYSKIISIELKEGGNGYYDTVWGFKKGIKSLYINDLHKIDQMPIVEAIVAFISLVEGLKERVR